MIIGVVSDTHDKLPIIGQILDYFRTRSVDMVLHCGDWKSLDTCRFFAAAAAERQLPVEGVLGNNDTDVGGFLEYASQAPGRFDLHEGVLYMPLAQDSLLAAYHGHHGPTVRILHDDVSVRILLLGHTHKPIVRNDAGKLIVNPGSTAFAIPRRTDWRPTVAVVDTDAMSAELHGF